MRCVIALSEMSEKRDNSSIADSSEAVGDSKTRKRKIYTDGQKWTRLTGAPAWDLSSEDSIQNFTGRCRLFVANLPQSASEESLRELFSTFGQISDIFIGKGNQFAFVKMDTKTNAENAKQAIDGKSIDGRNLRVRLAAHAAAVKVSQLPPHASNELLRLAFSAFGPVERAVVSADDRGRSLSEGFVEFARKSSSQAALKKCQNECLLMSSTPIPVVVTPLESRDDEEGVPEKSVLHAPDYRVERELGPRFAEPGSMEWEMARKWKQLSEIETQRREALESEIRDLRDSLRQQMEFLRVEETTKQLREQLRQMETESQKLCEEREQRLAEERRREDQRRQTEQMLRSQEEQLLRRNQEQDLVGLRRQEAELRQQANALQQLLDRQESALRQMGAQEATIGGPQTPAMDAAAHAQMQQMAAFSGQMSNQFVGQMTPLRQPQPQPQWSGGRGGGGGGMGSNIGSNNGMHFNKRNRRF
ncbi:paraspeckle component 1-like [Oppia nitens]|uniref:paraspeckle component 1-like n=1 Tax=Oppia nitens TaxID=1686743 RepID=UPI0023DA4738|nr:paraspeckle component 1-like [Oppia nitens]